MLMTRNFSYHFQQILSQKKFNSYKIQFLKFHHGWLLTFYLSTLLKLNFFSLVFQHNLLKYIIPHSPSLATQQYNLFLLLEILVLFLTLILISFSDHISYISKSCFAHIRDLRRIRNTLDHTTSCTIATSLIHSKLDYCNSLFLNINSQQLNRLQLILNSAARAVTKTPKFHHITPHLKSLHWLKITQRIQYKILSLTYKSLQYNKPSSISDLLTIQPTRSTRSSAVVTLQRPSNPSRLKISDRSFYYQAPVLWNSLPHHLRSHSLASSSQWRSQEVEVEGAKSQSSLPSPNL